MDDLVLNNIGLIYKAMKNLNYQPKNQDDFEEMYYAGLIGLIRASKTYKPNQSKSTYFITSIQREMIHIYMYRGAQKRAFKEVPLETDNYSLIDMIPSSINIEKEIILKDEYERIVKVLETYPRPRAIEMFKKYYGIGYKQKKLKELEQEYGITYQRIGLIIKQVLKYIRKGIKNV